MTRKLLYIFLFSLLVFTACQKAPEPHFVLTTPHQRLRTRLDTLRTHGIMYGHMHDELSSTAAVPNGTLSDTYRLTNNYPAVMGFDLSGIEAGMAANTAGIPFKKIKEQIVAHYSRGGIVMLTWHPINPVTGGPATDTSDTTVVRQILPGGALHDQFVQSMYRLSEFLRSLSTRNGSNIPYVFQPWDKADAPDYWWGTPHCSDKQYQRLWLMLKDYLKSRLYSNPIWCYTASLTDGTGKEASMHRYPGADYVDMIGLDARQTVPDSLYREQLSTQLAVIDGMARSQQKFMAITACGIDQSPTADWWSRIFVPLVTRYPLCFVITGTNTPSSNYGPSPETSTADDFLRLVRQHLLLLLPDIIQAQSDASRDSSELLWL
ncbi:MAG: glycoside hydrolase family 26 protein [Bacteroidales bacterium]|nr:glycoside hydrolase family 26 protein [Bacteroidales bacterium]